MKYLCVHCGVMLEKTSMILLPKSEVILNDWILQYDLQIPLSRGGDQFVCKTHLEERSVPKRNPVNSSSTQSTFSQNLTSEEYSQEVQSEHHEVEDWVAPKLEADNEEDYGMGFELEDNSYGVCEDQVNYGMDQQPSTSSANYFIPPRLRIGKPPMPHHASIPLSYPDLSDNQIMTFCVKTSTNISGEVRFECGMCPAQFSNTGDTRSVRLHLQNRHCDVIENFIGTGRSNSAPKEFTKMSNKTADQANLQLCEFLIKNGLPLETVRDRNLEMLCFNMNSSYALPSVDTLYEYMNGMVALKSAKKSNITSGPVSVTFDTTSFNNRNYLAFTVHYLLNKKKARSIFLREFEMTEPIVSSIMCTVRNAMEEAGIRAPITSVVSGSVDHEEALDTIGSFKQVNICFTENLNKFAEALIKHPIFAGPLQKLRDFITKFPTNRIVWGRFKAYLIRKRTYGEYPEIDGTHWYSTLDMVTKCCHMHRLFSDFVQQSNSSVKYIAPGENVEVLYLQHLLTVIKNNMKSLLESNTTIADVIPAIMDINRELGQSNIPQVIDTVNVIFNRLLLPFVHESDSHRFALFLHPRKYSDTVFSAKEWESIGRDISTLLAVREQKTGINVTERLRTSYQHNETVTKEIKDYIYAIGRVSGIESDVMDFWYRHEKRFPKLAKLAKELFLIPVYSIDAAFYLGEYGLLTYALQEMKLPHQKTLLLAASDLVDFRPKGDVMSKTICVKRKKEHTQNEDLWYTPIDHKGLAAGEPRAPDRQPRLPPPAQNNRFFVPTQRRPQMFNQTRTSFRDEVAKLRRPLPPQKVYAAVDHRPSPYPRPIALRQEMPQPLKEPKDEPMVEVKQEEDAMSGSTAERKFYAVRTTPGTTQRVIKTADGKYLRVNRARVPVPSYDRPMPGYPDAKKYFVRTKTGGVAQIQRRPVL